MSKCFALIKYYVLIVVYSVQYLFLHFINRVLHPQRYKKSRRVSVPPKCLFDSDYGFHQYAKVSVNSNSHFGNYIDSVSIKYAL